MGVDDGIPNDCLGQRRCVARWIGRNNPDKQLLRIPVEERGEVYVALNVGLSQNSFGRANEPASRSNFIWAYSSFFGE